MIFRFPPMYVSSTSTGLEKRGPDFFAAQTSRIRWSMNHADL